MRRKKSLKVFAVVLAMTLFVATVPAVATENVDTQPEETTEESVTEVTEEVNTDLSEDMGEETPEEQTDVETPEETEPAPAEDEASVPVTLAASTISVSVSPSSANLNEVGKTAQLTATLDPADAEYDSMVWSSDNTDIATVDQNGKVTSGSTVGTAIITVTVTDLDGAEYTADCRVTLTYTGLYKDSDNNWYYYKKGEVDTSKTGVVDGTVDGTSGQWNIVNGQLKREADVVKYNGDWWYFNANGMLDKSYTGFAKNSNGTWYMEKGKLERDENTVIKDSTGALGSTSDWYYVIGSKVQYSFTGLANYRNSNGWFYITNGKVDRSVTTVAQNKNGWFYVKNGKVDKSYTGFAKNSKGSWYVKSGKVSKTANGVYKDSTGAIGAKENWYYVKNNKVQYNFTGIASNSKGNWYIKNGKLDRSYNGSYTYNGTTYTVKNGKATIPYADLGMSSTMYNKAQSQTSSTKWLVMVDVDNCKVGIFQGSQGNWVPKKCWTCTTGAPSTPTVRGTWTIYDKGLSFGDGYTCWYYNRFHNGYMLHSILYNPGSMTSVQDDADSNESVESETASENGEATEVIPEETTEDSGNATDADIETSTEEESVNTDDSVSEGLSTDETNEEVADENSEEEQSEEAVVATLAAQTLSVEDYVNEPTNLGSLKLEYDDRYDLSTLSGISSDVSYIICMKEEDRDQDITSYQVSKGVKSGEKDEALITQTEEGSTKVAASGVGEGDVYIIRTEDLEKLETLAETIPDADDQSQTDSDNEDNNDESSAGGDTQSDNVDDETPSPDEMVDVYKLTVTVEAAPLTLMFLAGQSNMEGYCQDTSHYEYEESIACEDGTVYSTYYPSSASKGQQITGISFGSLDVAGSLQGAVETEKISEDSSYIIGGTLSDPLDISGKSLTYPLNSLTAAGNGKAGPDSGLAYEWHSLTGDKVWVINTACGSTEISTWVPGGNSYVRFVDAWNEVKQTYNAEIAAGHYKNGSVSGNKLVFWLQGETNDSYSSADTYESSFGKMYSAMCNELGSSVPFGIIMVRAGYKATSYKTAADLVMTGPRIAQYFLGSSNSSYGNVFVVSNANEQWVSDSGVSSYFKSAYSGGFDYPMQGASKSLPTKVDEVHGTIHYSQVGHNENGITAAYGMWAALGNASSSCKVSWKDKNANSITSVTLDGLSDTTTVVPIVDPVYLAKKVSYSISDKSVISYDYATGSLQSKAYGTSKITPSGGSGTLSVAVNGTDIVKINGVWTYTVNGKADYTYTGLAQNSNGWYYIKNGVLDRTYTGFAKNENGSWYVTEGKLTRKDNSVLKDENGAIGAKNNWYYVVGSKVQYDYTGLAKNSNGWWYIKNGVLDRSYTGFAKNENGSWYVTNGKLTRNDNSVIQDKKGALGSKSEWYYVIGSKVQSSFTGLADYKNSSGWWYITKGKVDRSANTVAKNKNGWYYVKNGKVDKSYTGFAANSNGKWYVASGKVTKKVNGVYKDSKGSIGAKNNWYYVVGNKVRTDFTGLANYRNSSGWWYITEGKVDRSFTGIATNKNGTYYLKNGKVQKSYSGSVKVNGKTYQIKNGKVV